MAVTIGSNIASLGAQRQLSNVTEALGRTYTRLASGLRINTASDDAAGLAVASGLNVNARIYTQALRNVNDGVSALNIADSAASQLKGIVIRVKELAEQAANGTYSTKQRSALDLEAQALSKEYFRLIHTTGFNGLKLLNGTFDQLVLQAGFGEGGTIASGVGGAIGTGTFRSGTSYTTPDQPFDVDLGDLNGDGVLDMAAANLFGSSVTTYFGNGDGTFRSGTTYSTSAATRSVELGDVNGDGVLDMLAVQEGGPSISVFLGVGDGSFRPRTTFNVADGPEYLDLSDFNGDGLMDIASVTLADTVRVYLSNGDGTFRESAGIPAVSLLSVSTGDLNNDGKMDMVTAGHTTTSVFLGNGDGTFQPQTTYINQSSTNAILGDFTNDGILDIVTTSSLMEILVGRGNGTFYSPVATNPVANAYIGETGDFNGDGNLDIAASDNNNSNVVVYLGNGNGTFKNGVNYSAGSETRGINLGDLNGDSVLDIVSTGAFSDEVNVTLANTKSGTSPLIEFSLKSIGEARQAMGILDNALKNLQLQSAVIGSFQSRLKIATSVVRTSVEGYKAAASRIEDADMGEEYANLTRNRILQQVASSVLAQANLQPNLAIRLLESPTR